MSSKKAVYVALIGNLAVATFKFLAAILGKSSAMLAESFHSLSDTGNQILLLVGIQRSKKAPDKDHPFGYGKIQFFYAFIVAMLLFGFAGILSIREGISKILNPVPLKNLPLLFISLIIAAFFEGYALRIAHKDLHREMKTESIKNIFQAIKHSKNPVTLTVIFEDSVALLSILIAGCSIFLAYLFNNPILDGVGSLLIGILLMLFALTLAYEIKKLLIGESISEMKREEIIAKIFTVKEVRQIVDFRAIHLGPKEVLVNLEVHLKRDLNTTKIERIIDEIEKNIKKIVPKSLCYIEVEQAKAQHTFGGITRKDFEKIKIRSKK